MTLRHFVVLGVTKAMLKSWGNDVKAKWKETIFPTITDKEAKYSKFILYHSKCTQNVLLKMYFVSKSVLRVVVRDIMSIAYVPAALVVRVYHNLILYHKNNYSVFFN
jgi:hypothetical protein